MFIRETLPASWVVIYRKIFKKKLDGTRYFEMPSIKPFLPFIASSRLGDSVWSDEHNAFMFVERAWAQPRE
ncbi:hypothetical protein NECAME_18672, partial [Necator americanus]